MITFDSGFIKNIPRHWKVDRIKDVIHDYHGGSTPRSDSQNWEKGDIVWITPTDFQKYKEKLLFDSERKITEIGLKSCSTKIVPKNTIIMCSRASVGDVRIAGTELCTNQGFINFIVDDTIFFKFLFYIIKGHLGDYFNEIAPGTTYKEISGTKAVIEKIPIPPFTEQKLISAYLDKTTAVINKAVSIKKEQLNKLEELKKSIIYKAVTKGLDDSVEMKDSGIEWIGEIPEEWEVKRIKRILVQCDYGISESTGDNGNIKILKMGNIEDGSLNENNIKYVDFVRDNLLLQKGDILYNRTNSHDIVGKAAIYDKNKSNYSFASYLVRLRTDESMNPYFLNYYINTPQFLDYARKLAIPSVQQANLNPTRYCQMFVPIPDLMVQSKIVLHINSKFKELSTASEKITLQIEKLEQYKKSLIHECVTGKRRITETDIPEAVYA